MTDNEIIQAKTQYQKELAYHKAVKEARQYTQIDSNQAFRGESEVIADVLLGQYLSVSKSKIYDTTIYTIVTYSAEREFYCEDISKLPQSAIGLTIVTRSRIKGDDGIWKTIYPLAKVTSEDNNGWLNFEIDGVDKSNVHISRATFKEQS